MDWDRFQKPQHYIGNEWNAVRKSHQDRLAVCLCFPDLYEVGMSNLGLRIIYGMLNEYDSTVCERCFMPGPDLLDYLREKKEGLVSLETKTLLSSFDVLAFNLGCELNYTNFLTMLSLSRIPLHSEQRQDIIVIGGGIANPEPIAPFVDVFYLGEFEPQAEQFVRIMTGLKEKKERLKALAELEGFYVPSFYEVRKKKGGYVCEKQYSRAGLPLSRVYVKDLDRSYYPLAWLTPHTQIVHDRVQIEIARGCPNRCAFCQARSAYYPYREKSPEVVMDQIKKIYSLSGYEDFSLLALSASNYSRIEELIDRSIIFLKDKGAGLSLPSLRVDDIVGRLHKKLRLLKSTALTVALEAGSEELRARIKKNIDPRVLWEARDVIRSLSLRHIKLYFMFGLPEEKESDLAEIALLVRRLHRELGLRLHVSINPFMPKPFTEFESAVMDREEVLRDKKEFLLRELRYPWLRVAVSNIERSVLEAILSRGDRFLSRAIETAFRAGACFDSYGEWFRWDLWKQAFDEAEIDYRQYLYQQRQDQCWAHLNKYGKIQN